MLEVEGEWPYCFELIGSIVQPIGFFTLIHMFGYFKKSNILVILFFPRHTRHKHISQTFVMCGHLLVCTELM